MEAGEVEIVLPRMVRHLRLLILALVVVVAMMLKAKGKGSVGAPGMSTSTVVSRYSPPERHPPSPPPGQPGKVVLDANVATDVVAGAPPGPGRGVTAGSALGNAGGIIQPKAGGSASEAKAGQPKKPVVVKRKPAVVKHPTPKRRR